MDVVPLGSLLPSPLPVLDVVLEAVWGSGKPGALESLQSIHPEGPWMERCEN